jgi:adenylyltransferase/sulfurtransferase
MTAMTTSEQSNGPANRPANRPATGAVLIIGAGGLGCPAALAVAAAGVRRIGIVDDDRVEASNLHRQILHRDDTVGTAKVASLAAALSRRFPEVKVTTHAVRFGAYNAAALLRGYDVVIDGSDNFVTKFVANDAAVLGGMPRCLFEELPPAGVGPSCAEAGVMGPVPGVIGALQGAEAARLLRGETPAFIGRLIQYDSLRMSFRAVTFKPNPHCGVCGAEPRIRTLDASQYLAPDCTTES